MHEIQRDPNFDQMVDKMAPKPTKERNSSKRKDRSNDDQQSRGNFIWFRQKSRIRLVIIVISNRPNSFYPIS